MPFVREMGRFGLEIFQEKLHDDNGYINILREIDTPSGLRPAYLSVSLIRQAAARIPELRLVDAGALELAKERIETLEAMLADATTELEEAEAQLARVNGVVRSGFKIVKATGAAAHKTNVVKQ